MRVELDEVAGDVLDFGLCLLLDAFPSTGAQLINTRRFTLLALVFRNLVQRVDGHEHHIVVLINQLDDLLRGVSVRQAHQARKLTDAMVDVYHIVPRLELTEFLQRKGYLATTCAVASEAIFMEAVEDLMIGEEAAPQGVVGKALVQGLVHISKGDAVSPFLEDVLQSLGLLLAIRTDVEGVSFLQEVGEARCHESEVLVENGLCLGFEGERGVRSSRRLVPELDTAIVQGFHGEVGSIRQVADNVHQFLLMFLISRQSQGRNGLFMNDINTVTYP